MTKRAIVFLSVLLFYPARIVGQTCDGPGLTPECIAQRNAEAGKCKGMSNVTREELAHRHEAEVQLLRKPACQRLNPAKPNQDIFIGKLMKLEVANGYMLLDGECWGTILQTAHIQVLERFSGTAQGMVVVHAGDINGFHFSHGRFIGQPQDQYLVVATRLPDGSFKASPYLTKPLGKDAAEDLKFLRGWRTKPPVSEIFGEAIVFLSPENSRRIVARQIRPLEGKTVTVAGPETRTAHVNAKGRFSISGLLPGHYVVNIETPYSVWPGRSQRVDVVERGCAEVEFHVDPFAPKP